MIMHICVGTRDLEKAGKFYDAIAAVLGKKIYNALQGPKPV